MLVTTDVASEGFNIEFTCAVSNYDLPWRLQKVEQRIGRVHRIGQKNDVLVFNFLNNQNFADVRIYELAYRKTITMCDILGASDNFISDINHNKYTNRAVADMIYSGRSSTEVAADFNELQQQFEEFVEDNKSSGDEMLFNSFD